jgi:hypothetical protein
MMVSPGRHATKTDAQHEQRGGAAVSRHEELEAKARELGASSFSNGINWSWAKGFPSDEAGYRFAKWLEDHGWEHRGVYADGESVDVRYR